METGPSKRVGGRIPSLLRRFMASSALAACAGPPLRPRRRRHGNLFRSSEVITFSVLIGVISAAMISAIWLIRQRGNIETENRELNTALADANQRISRFQALIADKNRRIVVWEGLSNKPEFLGQLPVETGAPQDDRDFLAFGRWIKSQFGLRTGKGHRASALRARRASIWCVETTRNEIIEAQGRVSGGRAFVRFVALNNLRAELAELKLERDRLHGLALSLQTLLDAIDLPVWQRGADGALQLGQRGLCARRSRPPIAAAGGQGRPRASGDRGARKDPRDSAPTIRPIRRQVSTVVQGNRTFFDVVDARSPAGSAGMAIDVSDVEAVREELNRTLKSHAETLDHLATPVAIFDGSQRLQFYNQAFQRALGSRHGLPRAQAGQWRDARPAARRRQSCRSS